MWILANVSWMSGLVFCVWTCVLMYGLVFWQSPHHPVVYVFMRSPFSEMKLPQISKSIYKHLPNPPYISPIPQSIFPEDMDSWILWTLVWMSTWIYVCTWHVYKVTVQTNIQIYTTTLQHLARDHGSNPSYKSTSDRSSSPRWTLGTWAVFRASCLWAAPEGTRCRGSRAD